MTGEGVGCMSSHISHGSVVVTMTSCGTFLASAIADADIKGEKKIKKASDKAVMTDMMMMMETVLYRTS